MIRLNNYARKIEREDGRERFKWIVFVDEDEEVLDQIEYVEYLLHPTFPNPRRIVSNRESHFALKSSGWGQFIIKAIVHLISGKVETTQHYLDFSKKWLKPKLKIDFKCPPSVRSSQIFSVTTRIANIGKGAARDISLELPIDKKSVLSGYMSYTVDNLNPGETKEFSISLQAPTKGKLGIEDFDITFRDTEGTQMTKKVKGILIPIREVERVRYPLVESPFTVDSLIGGKYQIKSLIGQGHFGRVYLATDTYLKGRTVALKVLRADFVDDPRIVESFVQMARNGLDLQSPNIVRVFEVGKETLDDQVHPYMIIEYVHNRTLQYRLSYDKPMSILGCTKVIEHTTAGLMYAHQQKVLHGDIRPSSIFYDAHAHTWKLGDFGLAEIVRATEVTEIGPSVQATLAYVAPEVLKGRIAEKSDVYSLGTVFREMLTGNPEGDLSKLEEKYRGTARAELIGVVERMTKRNRARRPEMIEVYETLRPVLYELRRLLGKEWRISGNFEGLKPREFEALLIDLFGDMGYDMVQAPKTTEYGADIVAKKGRNIFVVQAKKFAPDRKVSKRDIQQLLDSLRRYEANKGILVTSSDFTRPAYEQAEGAPIELWNHRKLREKIKEYMLKI